MDKEITITIKREDLQALYRAYLTECYFGLEVQCVETQKEMAEQKERIEKIINEAMQTEIDESNACIND